jgi:hypothetical protein
MSILVEKSTYLYESDRCDVVDCGNKAIIMVTIDDDYMESFLLCEKHTKELKDKL